MRVQAGVTGEQRWAVQGVARALQAALVDTQVLALADLLAGRAPPTDVLVVVQPGEDTAARLERALPPALPVLWLGSARVPAGPQMRAQGLLAADADDARLAAAVHALAAGLHVADATQRARWPDMAAGELPAEPLTARELEVLELLAKGLANRDIAAALGVTTHTAKFHVAQILEKLGAATRTEAVRQALRMGLVGL